ncbi:hydrophobin 2 [Rhodocollybia butyracea]|uniref:Hydrophobin n=1 Tax=Rhodocollybia butyracea TaxID=206335 RepID=A0A9P5U300_9AGAR|nr:hydrophobin 2 [Rhodocollybia butyracea]
MQLQFVFITAALSALVVATPSSRGEPASACTTGPIVCCNTITTASNPLAQTIIMLLGITVDPSVFVGLTCTPVATISPNACAANLVCCEDNTYDPLISIGCVPVSI